MMQLGCLNIFLCETVDFRWPHPSNCYHSESPPLEERCQAVSWQSEVGNPLQNPSKCGCSNQWFLDVLFAKSCCTIGMGCINNVLMENVGYDYPIAQNPAKTEARGCGGVGLGRASFWHDWFGGARLWLTFWEWFAPQKKYVFLESYGPHLSNTFVRCKKY